MGRGELVGVPRSVGIEALLSLRYAVENFLEEIAVVGWLVSRDVCDALLVVLLLRLYHRFEGSSHLVVAVRDSQILDPDLPEFVRARLETRVQRLAVEAC